MNKVRIGVIGCGYWGPNLVRNFAQLPSSEVVAVADYSDDRLAYVQKLYPGVDGTKNYRDLFSMNLDAVVVATPPATHHSIARDSLHHGLHTFVEKPITLNSNDAEELISVAARNSLILMVGHTFEYNPAVIKLKEIVDSGEIGDLHYIDAVRVNLGLFQPDLNVLWDLAPHDLSILLYVLGQEPISVSAHGNDCIFTNKHDIVYLHLKFPNGTLAHIHVSWLDPRKVRRITVVGSKKMVVYDDIDMLEKIKIFDKGVETLPYTDTYGDFQCSYRYGDVVIPHINFTEPLRIEAQHFVDCIVNNRHPQSDGLVGLRVVKVLEAAERSLFSGGRQEAVFEEERESESVSISESLRQ